MYSKLIYLIHLYIYVRHLIDENMIKYKYICSRFIVDKNVKIYKKESSNKLYCKNKINTKNGKKTCMIALNNYIKKRKKIMLLKHKKKQVPKKSSKMKTNSPQNNKKKTRNTLRGKKYNIIKGGGIAFIEEITDRKISALMVDENTSGELGHFSLNTIRPYELSVSIDLNHQGKGYANELLKTFYNIVNTRHHGYDVNGNNIYVFENGTGYVTILNDSDMLAIDADASANSRGNSFWDHIGMKPNRHYDRQNKNYESRGYEKTIPLKELLTRIKKIQ